MECPVSEFELTAADHKRATRVTAVVLALMLAATAVTVALGLVQGAQERAARSMPAPASVAAVKVAQDIYELYSDERYDPIAECLITLGWRGLAGDGVPRIFAPWQDIEWCRDINAPMDANTAVPLHDVKRVWHI